MRIMRNVDLIKASKLLASNVDKGFYGRWYHLLEEVAKGREYKVYSLSREDVDFTAKEIAEGFKAIKDRLILKVPVEEGYVFAVSEEKTSYMEWYRDDGFRLWRGLKTQKRVKSLLRPYTFFAKFPASEVKIVLTKDKQIESSTDGAIVISKGLWEKIKDQTLERLSPEDRKHLEAYGNCKVFNGRIFPKGRFGKGQVFVSDKLQGCEIYAHACNFKKELTFEGDVIRIGLDPQPGKLKAFTNKQVLPTFPEVFGIGLGVDPKSTPVYRWLEAELDRKEANLEEGALEFSVEELISDMIHGRIEESYTTGARIKALQFHAHGSIRDSAALMRQAILPGIDRMADRNELSIRVQIPGATYCQLVSADVMEMLGKPMTIEDGCCVYDSEYKVYVVNRNDYVANLRNHGGMDGDDKLCQVFRKRGEEIVVWMQRNPSGRGEYSVYKFIGIPPVDVPDLQLPEALQPQATELDRSHGELPKLPSQTEPLSVKEGEYTFADALLSLIHEGSSPGGYINLVSLWDASHPRGERCQMMPPMETMVDATTQTKDTRDLEFLESSGKKLATYLIGSKLPLDKRRFKRCAGSFGTRKQYEALEEKLTEAGRLRDSWFAKLVDACADLVKVRKDRIEKLINLHWNRQEFISLLPSGIRKEDLKVVEDRYNRMCKAYGHPMVQRNAKGTITPQGHTTIQGLIEDQVSYLVKYLEGKAYKNPWEKVMVCLAHVGHHSEIRWDYIMVRDDMFQTYLKMYKALKKKNPSVPKEDNIFEGAVRKYLEM